MKRYVLGDVHANIKALRQVFEESNFDYKEDFLIIIGDVVDGYCGAYECVEELIKVKNKVFIIGNHDIWFMDHIANGWSEFIWTSQGGNNTIKSYKHNGYNYKKMPKTHKDFFNSGVYWYEIDEMMFVHGGFEYPTLPKDSTPEVLTWDRSLITRCKNRLKIKKWKKIFVGHTTTENDGAEPITHSKKDGADLIQIDCGAGWLGRLCLYNIDTHKYFLSDYAEAKDRHKFD